MEALRQQIMTWCLALKDYLKCEQCQGKLSSDIYLCEAGHLVCVLCLRKSASNLCTLCKLPYTKTRNYLAEDLAAKMKTIMEKIGDDEEDDDGQSVCSESSLAWNTYPCWIGRCKFQGSPEDIRKHCYENHRNLYETLIDGQLPLSRSWNFDYSLPRTSNRIVDVTGLGLFLLHVQTWSNGALRAYVFMYASGRAARNYKYQLKIECNGEKMTAQGDVDSTRIPRNQLGKKGLFVHQAHNLQIQLQDIKKFTVSVEISKNDKTANESTPGNSNKKNKFKNRKSKLAKSPADDQNPEQESPQNRDKSAIKSGITKNPPTPGKQCMEKKPQDFHKKQSKVNNCLQTANSSGGQLPASQSTLSGHPIPPLIPGLSSSLPPLNSASYHPGYQNPLPTFHQRPTAFNPYVPPPSHYGNQPSAPLEENPHLVNYPDLTSMRQGMQDVRLNEIQKRNHGRERGETKPKDKCCIS